jgi:hypothetical protein
VVPVELLDAANDVQIAQSLTSLPKKLSFAEQRG